MKISIVGIASFFAIAMAGSALAADLTVPEAAVVPTSSPLDWSGFYVGANAGFGTGASDFTGGVGSGDFDMSGMLVGGQFGYNFHLTDGVVAGVQADLDWSNISGSDATISDVIDWSGAVTGHIGYDVSGFMPYVLGGVAFAESTRTHTVPPESNTQTHIGWTVGAGLGVKLTDNLSAFAEYRYSDYGAKVYTYTGSPEVALTTNAIRIGLNFHPN